MIPFEKIMDFLVSALDYWSQEWNNLNIPLKDWFETDIVILKPFEVLYDRLLVQLGIGNFSLLEFVLGSGVAYLTFFIVLRWIRVSNIFGGV